MDIYNISNYLEDEYIENKFLFTSCFFLGIHDIPQLYNIYKNKNEDNLLFLSYLLKCLFLLFLSGYSFYVDSDYIMIGSTACFFQTFMISLFLFHYSYEKPEVLPN